MTTFGFLLRKLQVLGTDVEPAELVFQPGLNVISGLSDTGKSYILQCIDYMLGAQTSPKQIKESKPYNTMLLEIETQEEKVYTLERNMNGNIIFLHESPISQLKLNSPQKKLSAKHDGKSTNNISAFILTLCGMWEVKLRKNKKNETDMLSFRTISHLFLINETQIIQEDSPIYHAKKALEETKLKSAFKFLLTGKDDNSLIAEEDPKEQKLKQSAKTEVYDQLIQAFENRISVLQENGDIREQIRKLKQTIDDITNEISRSSDEISERQQIRQQAWELQQDSDSRLIVISELLKRFNLLREHYLSDLSRLEFIGEGEYLFNQLESVNCPVCGQPLADHNSRQMCINNQGDVIDIQTACREEIVKINRHLKDLENTVETLVFEEQETSINSNVNKLIVNEAEKYIAEVLRPKQIAMKNKLDQLQTVFKSLAEMEIIMQQLENLRLARASLQLDKKPISTGSETYQALDKVAIRDFCNVVGNTLKSWKYPNMQIVDFDEKEMDIIISGSPRRNHGKGFRAFFYSAFTIGLMRYCQQNNLPHTNMVILDSPLTTLKEKENLLDGSNEDVSGEMHEAFFKDLATTPNNQQIIVLENKEPSPEIISNINFIQFEGKSGIGRKGFFPI